MRRSTHYGDSVARVGLVAGVALLLGIVVIAAISTAHIETPTRTVESKDCGGLSVADSGCASTTYTW